MKSLRELGKQFIWGISEPEEVSKVKNTVKSQLDPMITGYHVDTISPVMLREIATKEPLFNKAMKKKNKDTFRSGFVVKAKKPIDKVPERVLSLIDEFKP